MDILTTLASVASELCTASNLVFCLAIWAIVILIRRGMETIWPTFTAKPVWGKFLLPSLSIVIGAVLGACMTQWPFPAMFLGSPGNRAMFGIFCGLLSSYLYRAAKGYITEKLNGSKKPEEAHKSDDV